MRIAGTLTLCLLALAVPSRGAPGSQTDVSRLAWLEGVWVGTTDGVAMEEHWSSPAGGGLIGMHKDTHDGRMVSFEYFRIVTSDSAGLCYLSSPNGRPATPFCAIEVGDRRVVFENRAHDFPQRILYWREKDERLHARIEGTVAGASRSEEWVWTRRGARTERR